MEHDLDPLTSIFPPPHRARRTGEGCVLGRAGALLLIAGASPAEAGVARRFLEELCREKGWAPADAAPGDPEPVVRMRIAHGITGHAEGFRLSISPEGVDIAGDDPAGLTYGTHALCDLLLGSGGAVALPGCVIEDWPAFAVRGVMLDISRDRVPTMDELRRRVDLFARWRFNQLQLYMEHTFAYAGHEEVWREASPLTAAEVRELDQYCALCGIELVPNQNSFGHMERWLKHDRYAPLAEDPARRLTLCPVDPAALDLMRELYDELLPNFTSRLFNIGCDETWELGEGRSRAACAERGKGRVYLDYLRGLCAAARSHGRRPMFWGDIILHYPELIPELPEGAIALQWGYAAHEPHAEHSAAFAAAGVPFYICPGTSSWNSIAGRAEDWEPNLERAARLGLEHGASGWLVTDWGDNGHWQPWAASLPALAAGAAAGWTGRMPGDDAIAAAVARDALGWAPPAAGAALLAMNRAQAVFGNPVHNQSPAHFILQRPELALPEACTRERFDAAIAALDAAREAWAASGAESMDLDVRRMAGAEVRWATRTARHAMRLGRARLASGSIKAIPPAERAALAADWAELRAEYPALWHARSRPGGLPGSAGRFEIMATCYEHR